jgi:hypothetical protein
MGRFMTPAIYKAELTRQMLADLGPGTLVCTGHGAVEVQSYPLPSKKNS